MDTENDNTPRLLCHSCRRCRRTTSGHLVCTDIGNPTLVWRYGNRCRRYSKLPTAPPSLFDIAQELCESCLYHEPDPGDGITPDICAAEPDEADMATDADGRVISCRHYTPAG